VPRTKREEEKRKFEERKKQSEALSPPVAPTTPTTPRATPIVPTPSRQNKAVLEAQTWGVPCIRNGKLVMDASTKYERAYIELEDIMSQQKAELPIVVSLSHKYSTIPAHVVQQLKCVMIPQARDYGPAAAKAGYLVGMVKNQKGGKQANIGAMQGQKDSEWENNYCVLTKADLAACRCISNEKEGTMSNDVTGVATRQTLMASAAASRDEEEEVGLEPEPTKSKSTKATTRGRGRGRGRGGK